MNRNLRNSPWVLGALALALSSCASQTQASPPVVAFLKSHPELGTANQVEDAKDWQKGKRQRVISSSGKRLVFYLKGEQVQSVYDESTSQRVLVWSATPDTSETDQVVDVQR